MLHGRWLCRAHRHVDAEQLQHPTARRMAAGRGRRSVARWRHVGDWVAFGDAQTGKLDQANGRTKDAIGIVARCEKRDADAVKKATRPWWKIF
jgi:hypothetical protein